MPMTTATRSKMMCPRYNLLLSPQLLLLTGILTACPSLSYNRPYQTPQGQQGDADEQYWWQSGQQPQQERINLLTYIESYLSPLENTINQELLITQLFEPSKIYKFRDLLAALPVVYDGIADKQFYFGEDDIDLGWEYGLVNLAAFLAQCMKETIQYDACDENNWDLFNSQYPLANACGQLEQSYQDYACPAGEEHMQCEVDPDMRITATTHAQWYGAPPGLFCAPKTDYPWVGIWDYNHWCNNPWADPPESCDVYEGQKAGKFNNDEPVASRGGRTDVEGCCWWGRGVIQTTGVCNFGKLNYFLGARAAAEGREAKYPMIDFCQTPDKICSDDNYPELKWIAGFFYWMNDVQAYSKGGWYFKAELHKFVNSGMTENGFIDAISGIVNRGCHNPPCATGPVDGLEDRRANFRHVLSVFGLPSNTPRPPSTVPPLPAPEAPRKIGNPHLINAFLQRLSSFRNILESKVLSYPSLSGVMTPSDIYTFDTLIQSVATAYEIGYEGKSFYLGPEEKYNEDTSDKSSLDLRYALVNIAAFLAQSQSEGIGANACDEYHSDSVDGLYPVSNACGQFGNDYQDSSCSYVDKEMECPVVENMKAKAVLSGKYADSLFDYRPNLYCGPDEQYTGAYDPSTGFYKIGPIANQAGRTDVKGCCFWGRGALMSKGRCMLGKLNYHLGKKAQDDGRHALFPDIDFCGHPEQICRSVKSNHPTIVWDIALFEWIERIQTYDDGEFNYIDSLRIFVDEGLEDFSFIDAVSNIVTKGSTDAKGTTPNFEERSNNFKLLLGYLQLISIGRPKNYVWSQSQAHLQQRTTTSWMTVTGTLVSLLGIL